MGQYSIKQLEQLSGIRSHTIRIWEQRYGLLNPERTDTNIRLYNDSQLKKLLNIAVLNSNGIKISKISELSSDQFQQELEKLFKDNLSAKATEVLNRLILTMLDLDELGFRLVLHETIRKQGFLSTIEEVVYPFLTRVGIMWGLDEVSPTTEHFVTNIIKHSVIAETQQLVVAQNKEKKFLLFLPENEWHEMGLLIANYLLRKQGYPVFYMGQATPFADLIEITEKKDIQYLVTFFVKQDGVEVIQKQINELSATFKSCQLLIAGSEINLGQIKFPDNSQWVKSPADFLNCLTKM